MKRKFVNGKTYLVRNDMNETEKVSIKYFNEDRYYIYYHSQKRGSTSDCIWFDTTHEIIEMLPDEKIIIKF